MLLLLMLLLLVTASPARCISSAPQFGIANKTLPLARNIIVQKITIQ